MFGFMGSPNVPQQPGFGQNSEEFDDFPALLGAVGRRPAVAGRVQGSITEWRGKFGWITPDAPIMHAEAHMKGGRLHLSQEDVLEVISGVGAHVSFYVYCDGTGLGAMQCVPVESPTAKKKISKAKATLKPKPKATPGRKRIGETAISGKVKSWRGGFGFVTPSEPVEHPLFTGSLFLHSNDILSDEQVVVGKGISFFIYADPQGLGAEEATLLDGDDDPTPSASTGGAPTSSVELHESSGLLKAKPKASGGASADGLLIATPKAKGMMRATPKAAAAVKASGDPDLARKMADNPEIAKQLSAWMFDPGG